jgi:hypothetical protein
MVLSPLQRQGHDALIREFRSYEHSAVWQGCLQCLAEQRLERITSPRVLRQAGLRAAYVSGQILACRRFLTVPHSCDRDRMSAFLDGEATKALV